MPILWCPSPNHEPRRGGPADMLLLHYTGMPTCEGALAWLCTPESKVSAHYVVGEAGEIWQLVAEDRRAWHAGLSSWAGETDINSRAIGIEIHHPGTPDVPYPAPQIAAVIALACAILARHAIPPWRVLAHSDVAPARKIDPGAWFPWPQLAAAGIGLWVEAVAGAAGPTLSLGASGAPVAALQADLAAYGYGLAGSGTYDEATACVVAAFQRHYRPARVDGHADPDTRATLARLLAARAGLTS